MLNMKTPIISSGGPVFVNPVINVTFQLQLLIIKCNFCFFCEYLNQNLVLTQDTQKNTTPTYKN